MLLYKQRPVQTDFWPNMRPRRKAWFFSFTFTLLRKKKKQRNISCFILDVSFIQKCKESALWGTDEFSVLHLAAQKRKKISQERY